MLLAMIGDHADLWERVALAWLLGILVAAHLGAAAVYRGRIRWSEP